MSKMKQSHTTPHPPRTRTTVPAQLASGSRARGARRQGVTALSGGLLLLGGLLGGLAACGGGGSAVNKDSTSQPGDVAQKPDGSYFFADANQAGNAQDPRITRTMHGRLVEVFGLDSFGAREPMFSDFVIDSTLVTDGQNYLREVNPVTAQDILVILRDVTDTSKNGGRDQFFELLFAAEQGLSPIHENDADGAGLYSMVPRNAAIVVHFDDLIDPKTIDPTTLKFNVGNPPVVPFEARVFPDPNHGDLAEHDGKSGKEFYSTRIVIDTTVSALESFTQDPPLPVNGIGLPPSADVNLANIEVRIPTQLNANVGQTDLLLNPSGHALSSKGNGPTDNKFGTLDVVRAARSGGPNEVTGDKFNGFMLDLIAPRLVGSTPINIVKAPEPTVEPGVFVLPLVAFESVFCSQAPRAGDVLTQPGLFAQVIQPTTVDSNGEVQGLVVRLLLHPFDTDDKWATAGTGPADFLSAYDEVEDAGHEPCFVQVSPDATGFPENPVSGVSTDATYGLRFSEPMDPISVTAFDSVTVTRQPIPSDPDKPLPTSDYVVGTLGQSLDLQQFIYMSEQPLAHQQGESESYWLTLSRDKPATDLAGNAVEQKFPQIELTVDPTKATENNHGRVTRFTGIDEEEPIGDEGGPLPEWVGQHLYDLQRELIKPRPVVHFNQVADRSQPVPKLMTPFPPGVQTPLSGLGSKMQTLWRYCDFGWSMTDSSNHNLDVEGIFWSPAEGAVQPETFTEFSITVGHADFLPDEYIDPGSLFPKWPNSGLNDDFSGNWLKQNKSKVVHSRDKGYTVLPGNLFVHPVSGTKLIAYPWNQDVSPDEWQTYTWRDTDERKRSGKGGSGAPLVQEFIANGQQPPPSIGPAIYVAKQVRAEAMPFLMEFRCYPDSGAIGLNAFDISLASNSSSRPYFRAFSTGGINEEGNFETVQPDSETHANGGFNPGSNPPGAPTHGLDNSYYIGAADFVTRVSRVHSVWFRALDPFADHSDGFVLFEDPIYDQPITEPRDEDQPDGTKVRLHFRGAQNIRTNVRFICNEPDSSPDIPNTEPLDNALKLDPFGDYYDHTEYPNELLPRHNPKQENTACDENGELKPYIIFHDGKDFWRPIISGIDTAPYYQVRITFESDIFTGLVPELSALAISWHD